MSELLHVLEPSSDCGTQSLKATPPPEIVPCVLTTRPYIFIYIYVMINILFQQICKLYSRRRLHHWHCNYAWTIGLSFNYDPRRGQLRQQRIMKWWIYRKIMYTVDYPRLIITNMSYLHSSWSLEATRWVAKIILSMPCYRNMSNFRAMGYLWSLISHLQCFAGWSDNMSHG